MLREIEREREKKKRGEQKEYFFDNVKIKY